MTSHIFQVKVFLSLPFLSGFILLICGCGTHENTTIIRTQPQCAHWSIMKCCQLNGVSIAMSFLLEKLPPSPSGHSLLQISEVLREIGFETEGRIESESTFHSLSFPLIAHLTNPDHFVTIASADNKVVHVFDGNGRRVVIDLPSFFEQWGGAVLLVTKPKGNSSLPPFLPRLPSTPRIQFDSLLLDLGTVSAIGEPVPFEFTFRNFGDSDLIIEDVQPDCSCIKSEKPENAISPNGKGIIMLFYNVKPQKGSFSHNVIVKSNDPNQPIIPLVASGWSGVELITEPSNIYLSDLVQGQETKFRCLVKHTGDRAGLSMDIEEAIISNSTLISYKIEPLTDEMAQELLRYIPQK
ncbi:MAG: DUF1573 domain-containing protein [Planctomycetaceae bacterium]|nr:DUF1573 domain-containing protein [Planctomycetaceae bacterium]